MKNRGHNIRLTATDKDVTLQLLDNLGFDHVTIRPYGKSLLKMILTLPFVEIDVWKKIHGFKPDLFLSHGSIRASHVAFFQRKPSIVIDDDEYSFPYYFPFVSHVIGLSGFKKFGRKINNINSFKELAYLHPKYFKPDFSILKKYGIKEDERFVLLRFVSLNAFHDIGIKGFSDEQKIKLVTLLEKHIKVYIISEKVISDKIKKNELNIPPELLHHFLYYSQLLICDSQTMTTEGAILGTPVVRCNSFVGKNDMGNFIELEQKYGLIFNYSDPDKAIDKAIELIHVNNLKEQWHVKRDKMLIDKIDLTAFMIWFVENYPSNIDEMKEHPEIQYKFR